MSSKTLRATKKSILAKQRKALKSKKRFKRYTKNQNRYFRLKSKKARRSRYRKPSSYLEQVKQQVVLKVPKVFSINSDLEAVLKFVYNTKKIIEARRYSQIILDFSNVTRIDDGASTILLSLCYDISYKKIKVGINHLPTDVDAKYFIQQSGFIRYFSGPLIPLKNAGPNTTIKKGKSTILQKDSANLIHKTMQTVWGKEDRNQKLQGMLIELMTNSVNHAYLSNEQEKSWYISTNHYINENKVEFCFVDNGDGIINTVNVKFRLFIPNEEILVKAFEGQYRSRTKLANRGKGLIVVKRNHSNMTIKGLKVITNNVFLDFDTNIAVRLNTPFSGTFYSWVIDESCKY